MDKEEWDEAFDNLKDQIREGRTFEMTKEHLMSGMMVSIVLDMDRENEIESASNHIEVVDDSEIDSNETKETDSAVEKLKMRFAKGEIEKDEYQKKLSLLSEE
jgi:uncharacterized membrane protein